MRIIN